MPRVLPGAAVVAWKKRQREARHANDVAESDENDDDDDELNAEPDEERQRLVDNNTQTRETTPTTTTPATTPFVTMLACTALGFFVGAALAVGFVSAFHTATKPLPYNDARAPVPMLNTSSPTTPTRPPAFNNDNTSFPTTPTRPPQLPPPVLEPPRN